MASHLLGSQTIDHIAGCLKKANPEMNWIADAVLGPQIYATLKWTENGAPKTLHLKGRRCELNAVLSATVTIGSR
jgi:hypothetical protein